jgi:hypothetical protein
MLEQWLQAPVLVGTSMRVFDRALTLEELDEVHELNILDWEIDQRVLAETRWHR